MVSKKLKVRIQKSRKLKKSRKNRRTSRVTFRKGGGIWDSIKNVFSNKPDETNVENIIPQEHPEQSEQTEKTEQSEQLSSNIDISPINSGGCIQRKRTKKSKRA